MERKRGDEVLGHALLRMSASIPFYPDNQIAATEIALTLDRMCGSADQINWLVTTAINTWKKWEGIGGLRALYCSRFPPQDNLYPADEVDPDAAAERDYCDRESKAAAARIAAWKKEQKLLGDADRKDGGREVIEIWSGREES